MISHQSEFGNIKSHDYMGKNGFYWWVGIVEDNNDPLMLGRARVRIFGYHNDRDEYGITKDDLPWAVALASLDNPENPVSPPVNTWVLGFFLDGTLAQQPVMLGALVGYRDRNAKITLPD